MSATDLFEQRHRANGRRGLQQRHDLVLPNPGERVGTAASVRLFLL
jgi:hypothetical protein